MEFRKCSACCREARMTVDRCGWRISNQRRCRLVGAGVSAISAGAARRECELDGSVVKDRVPSSTRIWRAERAKKMNKSPCSSRYTAGTIPCLHLFFSFIRESSDYIMRKAARSGGPRGTRDAAPAGNAQAVTTHRPILELKQKVETQTYGWGRRNEFECHGCGVANADGC